MVLHLTAQQLLHHHDGTGAVGACPDQDLLILVDHQTCSRSPEPNGACWEVQRLPAALEGCDLLACPRLKLRPKPDHQEVLIMRGPSFLTCGPLIDTLSIGAK